MPSSRRRRLVAYVAGGDPQYGDLLLLSASTVRLHNPDVRIVLLCDKAFAAAAFVRGRGAIDEVHVTPANDTVKRASARKMELFRYVPDIMTYSEVLYLDCDIVVRGSLDAVWAGVAAPPHVLHVFPEREGDRDAHSHAHFGIRPPGIAEAQALASAGVGVFNAGQWAFRPSDAMRAHFDAAAALWSEDQFYEQPAMNHYFARRLLTTTSTLTGIVHMFNVSLASQGRGVLPSKPHVIVHAANASVPWRAKLAWLRALARIPTLAAYTDAHMPLLSRWRSTLPPRFQPMVVRLGCRGGPFGSPEWHRAISSKLLAFVTYLETAVPDGAVFVGSDVDIYFTAAAAAAASEDGGGEDALTRLAAEAVGSTSSGGGSTAVRIAFMRENRGDSPNGGFFVAVNGPAEREFLRRAAHHAETARSKYADQDFYASEVARGGASLLPPDACAWGRNVSGAAKALLHHAVCELTVRHKLAQQNVVARFVPPRCEFVPLRAELVVARCGEDVSWIRHWAGKAHRITVYDRSAAEAVFESDDLPNVHVVRTPNVGRETYCYLTHMATLVAEDEQSRTTAGAAAGAAAASEVVVFVQADWMAHGRDLERLMACDSPPFYPGMDIDPCSPSGVMRHYGWTPESNYTQGAAMEPCALSLQEFWAEISCGRPWSDPTPWHANAIFAVPRAAVLTAARHSPGPDRLLALGGVASHPNPEAAHYWERLWYKFFDFQSMHS